MSWNSQEIDTLKRLWLTDNFTATQCGQSMGRTRNAILSKVYRLKLPTRPQDAVGVQKPRARRISRPQRLTAAYSDSAARHVALMARESRPELAVEHPSNPVTFMELTNKTCRFPLGDPQEPDFMFCGARPRSDAPYCDKHCRIAYSPAPVRSSAAIHPHSRKAAAR